MCLDPLKQQQNPLGTRSEINHTINWVRTHLEQDPQVSIPKQDVYNDYVYVPYSYYMITVKNKCM